MFYKRAPNHRGFFGLCIHSVLFFFLFFSSFGLAFNLKANANDIHCLLGGVWGHTFSKTIAMVIPQPLQTIWRMQAPKQAAGRTAIWGSSSNMGSRNTSKKQATKQMHNPANSNRVYTYRRRRRPLWHGASPLEKASTQKNASVGVSQSKAAAKQSEAGQPSRVERGGEQQIQGCS
jgi:hypothetical protein